MANNAANSEWSPEEEMTLHQVQVGVQAVHTYKGVPHDPADHRVLEVSMLVKESLWSLWQGSANNGPWAQLVCHLFCKNCFI